MDLKRKAINKIKERGVCLNDIAKLVLNLQKQYHPTLTLDECIFALDKVLSKREVLHTILTGIAIDEAVENKKFENTIREIINKDEGLYGIDEILALSIVNVYGSIALTNFGYLDKVKPGVIGIIDQKGKGNECHTFFDDIICALVASSCAKIAHEKRTSLS